VAEGAILSSFSWSENRQAGQCRPRVMPKWIERLPGVAAVVRLHRRQRRIRQIRRELAAIGEGYAPSFAAAKTEDDDREVQAAYMDECRGLDAELVAIEWSRLVQTAIKLNLDVPGRRIVRAEQRDLRRRIYEARWAFWERVAKIVLPIASILIALAALFRTWR